MYVCGGHCYLSIATTYTNFVTPVLTYMCTIDSLQFVVDTHLSPFRGRRDVKMVIQQTGATHDQATSSLRDAGGDLVNAMLLLENSNTLI